MSILVLTLKNPEEFSYTEIYDYLERDSFNKIKDVDRYTFLHITGESVRIYSKLIFGRANQDVPQDKKISADFFEFLWELKPKNTEILSKLHSMPLLNGCHVIVDWHRDDPVLRSVSLCPPPIGSSTSECVELMTRLSEFHPAFAAHFLKTGKLLDGHTPITDEFRPRLEGIVTRHRRLVSSRRIDLAANGVVAGDNPFAVDWGNLIEFFGSGCFASVMAPTLSDKLARDSVVGLD